MQHISRVPAPAPAGIRDRSEDGIVPENRDFTLIGRNSQTSAAFNTPIAVFQGDQLDLRPVAEPVHVDTAVHCCVNLN